MRGEAALPGALYERIYLGRPGGGVVWGPAALPVYLQRGPRQPSLSPIRRTAQDADFVPTQQWYINTRCVRITWKLFSLFICLGASCV